MSSETREPGALVEPPNEGKTHYVYDGIEEQDNRLPNWWLGILFATIAFAFIYWLVYHTRPGAPGLGDEYQAAMRELASRQPAVKPLTDDELVALSKDEQMVEVGRATFAATCASCHGAEGQGLVGPNLTDGYFLHGGAPLQIHRVITNGVIDKGMPAWEQTLGGSRVRAVTAYVLTLAGKNLPGKPPQGELVR